jgi:bifunctional non-homologous end joining protein LigD
MYAQLVQQLPDGKDWLYEVKFDGYRCLAARDTAGVALWSRGLKSPSQSKPLISLRARDTFLEVA